MNIARIKQAAVERHSLAVLGAALETKDIKMTVKFKDLMAPENINQRLDEFHGEHLTESDTNFTIHLLIRNFSQRVSVNIPRGKNTRSQVQGLTNMDDMVLVMARFGQIGLRVVGEPQLSSVICRAPAPVLHHLPIPEALFLGPRALRNGDARLYFRGDGTMTLIGRNWDHIRSWVDLFAGHVIAMNPNPLLFAGFLGQ